MQSPPLSVEFYNRAVQTVARDLLGARLVRVIQGARLSGYIVEVEAYDGESDLACHARAGLTNRTRVMYGKAGRAYIYFVYGMHWMLNCVTGPEGHPAAVLIRAVLPDEGQEMIAQRRPGIPRSNWANGPGRVCQAFEIDSQLNGIDLTHPNGALWIEPGAPVNEEAVVTSPRIGIQSVPEPWRSQPWRYRVTHLTNTFETGN